MARTDKKRIAIKDEGMPLVDDVDSIDFTGAGVTGSNIGSDVTEDIPGGGGSSQNLQQVTDIAPASTTNETSFLDGIKTSTVRDITNGFNSGNFESRQLYDASQVLSIDWTSRQLVDITNTPIFNWSNAPEFFFDPIVTGLSFRNVDTPATLSDLFVETNIFKFLKDTGMPAPVEVDSVSLYDSYFDNVYGTYLSNGTIFFGGGNASTYAGLHADSLTTYDGIFVGGQIQTILGTVSAPSYSFTGDLNTGMWSPTADELAFSLGGLEKFRLKLEGSEITYGGMDFNYLSAPSAPSLALAGVAGLVPVRTNYYAYTFVNANGETQIGASASIVVASAANAKVNVTIAVGGTTVIARKIYRSTDNVNWRFLALVNDNTTTSYQDNIATDESVDLYRNGTYGNTTAGASFAGGTKVNTLSAQGGIQLTNAFSYFKMSKSSQTYPIQIFNTTDENNNAEFGSMRWNANVFEVGTFTRGTGAYRKLKLTSSNASSSLSIDLERGGTNWFSVIEGGTSLGGVSFARFNPTSWTASSGENRILTLGSVALSNTGTGGYSLFNIDATGGTGGSGSKFMARYTIGGTTVHSVNNVGNGYFLGNIDGATYSVAGVAGASGTFTTVDLKTVTVVNGIITSIV